MASVLTHVAVPLLLGRALKLPDGVSRRRLAIAAAACAVLPDLDLATFAFDVRAWDPIGHRGFFHSLLFAAVLAAVVSLLFFQRRAFSLLFAAAASHGLLDALTRGDVGVALLSPLTFQRFLFPLRPIPVCPLGVSEWLGPLGATVLFNELMLVVIPVSIGAEIARRVRKGEPFNSLTKLTAAWIAVAAALWLAVPSLYAPTRPRLVKGFGDDDDLAIIPDPALVTRFDELRESFGRKLEPRSPPWSSSFFPAWHGAEAGRWRDGRFTLIGRTLFGTEPLSPAEAKAALEQDHGARLSPSEKYDLANGDYAFTATRHSLTLTHDARPRPRFWFGLCNGVAAAGLERLEPFRAVDVATPDGHAVRFHPIDVKALLAEAYFWEADTRVLGGSCDAIEFDSGRRCSMNPGALLIGTVNQLVHARRSFLVEVHPSRQAQYYAVASARIDLTRPPYAPGDEPFEAGLRARTAALADVEFAYELSSTMLPVETGDATIDGERYHRVGLVPVPFSWSATIAIDDGGTVIGGRWRGDPANGPDNIAFVQGGPLLDGGVLQIHPGLHWQFIDALANESARPD